MRTPKFDHPLAMPETSAERKAESWSASRKVIAGTVEAARISSSRAPDRNVATTAAAMRRATA